MKKIIYTVLTDDINFLRGNDLQNIFDIIENKININKYTKKINLITFLFVSVFDEKGGRKNKFRHDKRRNFYTFEIMLDFAKYKNFTSEEMFNYLKENILLFLEEIIKKNKTPVFDFLEFRNDLNEIL